MNYNERIDHAREIIDRNRYYINHTPAQYENIQRILQYDEIKHLLLKVFRYVKERNFFIYRRKYVFFLPTSAINRIRGKTTKSVSSRYINFLCCVGFINKQYQHIDIDGLIEKTRLTGVNTNFLIDHPNKTPINTFFFRPYEKKGELARLEDRARRLIEGGITPGNLSRDMLIENGCADIADQVFFQNQKKDTEPERRQLRKLKSFIDQRLNQQGYTTKDDIYWNSGLKRSAVDKLFRIYKSDLWQQYQYKAPNKAEKDLYGFN